MDDTQLQKKTKPKTTTKNKTIESKTKKPTDTMETNFVHGFVNVPSVHEERRCPYNGSTFEEPVCYGYRWNLSSSTESFHFGKTYQLDTITTEYLHQTLVFLGHQLGPLHPQHPSEKKNTIKEMSTKKEPLLISNLQYAGVIRGVRRELTVFPFSPVGPAAPAGPSGPCGKKNADMTSNQQ